MRPGVGTAMACVLLLGCGGNKDENHGKPRVSKKEAAPVPSKTVDSPSSDAGAKGAALPTPPDDPEKADYKSGAEIKAAKMKELPGKTAVVRVQLTGATPSTIFVRHCASHSSRLNFGRLAYAPGLRDDIRAITKPPEISDFECQKSTRIYLQLAGYPDDATLQGTVLKVLDAEPQRPSAPPKGADFATFVDVGIEGPAAVGKTLETAVFRWQEQSLASCPHVDGYYGATLFVEAVPPKLQKTFGAILLKKEYEEKGICRVVRVRVVKVSEHSVTVELLDVGKEVRSPDAVDYVSFDKLKLDGKKAYNKLARFEVWRGNTDSKKFVAYPCGKHGGIDWVDVRFKPSQQAAVSKIGTDTFGCKKVKLKIKGKDGLGQLQAELLAVD